MVDTRKFLEERLREAACFGDSKLLEELISKGVDVNSKNDVNGWTALHWAAHHNLLNIVEILLENGADKNCLTNKGELPCNLASTKMIQVLLGGTPTEKEPSNNLPITPNYLKYPSLCSLDINNHERTCSKLSVDLVEEIVLKVRVANSQEHDFIEIEIPKSEMTYSNLIGICCKELNISLNLIHKIRKLPNTILRKDKDVQRLQDFQELEVVISKTNVLEDKIFSGNTPLHCSIVNGNPYESISLKKDQTILY